MTHQNQHQEIAQKLIAAYQGPEPLAAYLKKYFAANKKHGSRDRKSISAFCYAHFRTMHAHFPLQEAISKEIDILEFIQSHTIQPLLFIRIRPWQKEKVVAALQAAAIEYTEVNEDCFAFSNTTSLQNVLALNKEAVIQDLNSQALAELLSHVPTSMETPIQVWDACAASGGKTILMFDTMENIRMHVSDVRESILFNADKRLQEAGIRPASVQVIDLTHPFEIKKPFDFVFADLPCSGSGTWGRTPEQIAFFKKENLNSYTQLQSKIIENILPTVKLEGHLLIATCSVYAAENEAHVEAILAQGQFELIEQRYFKGYTQQADTLFGAILKRRSV
ncbi:MAG: methyltransferase domain-containing protein [Sediminibacterium sp.]|nr:methyltransferase domain-containing protein [Sediminibacterium sp.]MBP6144991.1 methyltransferase domain-containing protein [Sediminibacterium sp.]